MPFRIPIAKTNVTAIPAVGPMKRPAMVGQVQMISKIAVPSSVHYGERMLLPRFLKGKFETFVRDKKVLSRFQNACFVSVPVN